MEIEDIETTAADLARVLNTKRKKYANSYLRLRTWKSDTFRSSKVLTRSRLSK
jgi:hypothetical protein